MSPISDWLKKIGSWFRQRWQGLKVPASNGRYAREFYYAKKFDAFLFIFWPIIVVWDFWSAYYQAWHHKWSFIINAVLAPLWMLFWVLALKRRYRKR